MRRSREAAAQGPFRIHTVAEMTGVPEPTLRAWERRYGLPSPERTASGYRVYSTKDVELAREMRSLCDSGMAAADAAKLLLKAKRDAPADARPGDIEPYAASVKAFLDAVLRFDDLAIDLEIRKLMFLGTSLAILDRVLTPALHEIGRRWHEGELSVAQEHLASQRLSTVLRDLLRLSPGADSDARVLLACFAEDDHELGLLGTAIRFSSWGFRPIFLGARTPPGAIRSAIGAVSPALVALSVTVTPHPARARELVDEYAVACEGVPWLVGGGGVKPIAEMIRKSGGVVAPEASAELRALARNLSNAASESPSRTKAKSKGKAKAP
ncbi:MAG: MerR family transcriptional regulator [Polyangiaceae bacterium]